VTLTKQVKGSKAWQQEDTSTALETHVGPLLDGPLAMTFVFYSVPPRSNYGKGAPEPSNVPKSALLAINSRDTGARNPDHTNRRPVSSAKWTGTPSSPPILQTVLVQHTVA
jgi:hypothetical protein